MGLLTGEDLQLDPVGCDNDFDCVSGALCYNNKTKWFDTNSSSLDGSGFCECSTWYTFRSKDGITCTEVSGPGSTYVLSAFGTMATVAAVAALLGWFDFFRLYKSTRSTGGLKFDASLITLLSVTIGLSFHSAWSSLIMMIASNPEDYEADAQNGRDDIEKLSQWSLVMRPILFMSVVFTFISAVNISVMWIELAYRAKSLKARVRTGIHYYKRGVYTTMFFFCIAMGTVAALGRWELATLVAFPFLLGLGVTFTIGRRRMVTVLKQAMTMDRGGDGDTSGSGGYSSNAESNSKTESEAPSMNESTNDGTYASSTLTRKAGGRKKKRGKKKEKDMKERTRRAMLAVKRVSGHVIMGIVGVVISGGLYFLVNNMLTPFGWKDLCRPDQLCIVVIVNSLVPLALLYVLLAIFHYSHRNTMKLIRRANGNGQSSHTRTNEDTNSKSGSTNPSSMVMGSFAMSPAPMSVAPVDDDIENGQDDDAADDDFPVSIAAPSGPAPEAPL